jgi:large subunit ribosomal protein L2
MAVKSYRPLTPSRRYMKTSSFEEITKSRPEKSLTITKKKTGGRNHYGRVTARGIGGGHKQKIRTVDFRRNKHGMKAEVTSIEYDPIRSARIALVRYEDGEKRYIVAPNKLEVGTIILSGSGSPAEIGNFLPLSEMPIGSTVHNIELTIGRGGQLVRSAGGGAVLMSLDGGFALIKLPSGEIRKINEKCYAAVGQVGNLDHSKIVLGKAGRSRNLGRRPITRGVARNPIDHPMGGGAGRTSGGGHPVTPWGVITKGYKTRAKKKTSNKFIVSRRTKKNRK